MLSTANMLETGSTARWIYMYISLQVTKVSNVIEMAKVNEINLRQAEGRKRQRRLIPINLQGKLCLCASKYFRLCRLSTKKNGLQILHDMYWHTNGCAKINNHVFGDHAPLRIAPSSIKPCHVIL